MQIVETATRFPGHCILTGAITGPFVDFGIDYRDEGRLYVHEDAIREMFKLYDLTPTRNLADRVTELNEQQIELNEARNKIGALEAVIEAMAATRPTAVTPTAVFCRYCGATESSGGKQFYENAKAHVGHEQNCPQNPDRRPTIQERQAAKL